MTTISGIIILLVIAGLIWLHRHILRTELPDIEDVRPLSDLEEWNIDPEGMREKRRKKAMKKIIAIIFLAVLCLVSTAQGGDYSYDSEYDPAMFVEWDVIAQYPLASPAMGQVLKNPTGVGPTVVEITLAPGIPCIMAYEYIDGGEIHRFVLDVKLNRYERVEFTGESMLEYFADMPGQQEGV